MSKLTLALIVLTLFLSGCATENSQQSSVVVVGNSTEASASNEVTSIKVEQNTGETSYTVYIEEPSWWKDLPLQFAAATHRDLGTFTIDSDMPYGFYYQDESLENELGDYLYQDSFLEVSTGTYTIYIKCGDDNLVKNKKCKDRMLVAQLDD